MGAIFSRFVSSGYCPKCRTNIVFKPHFGKEHEGFEGSICSVCHTALEPPKPEMKSFYELRGFRLRIPEHSQKALLIVILPNLVFGLLGIVPLVLFLLDSIGGVVRAMETAFGEIYGSGGLLERFFGSSWIAGFVSLLSVYFGIRAVGIFWTVRNEVMRKERP